VTHYPTFDELLPDLDEHPRKEGTIRTTLIAGRLAARKAESLIRQAAYTADVDLSLKRLGGGLLEVSIGIEVSGESVDLAKFLRLLQPVMT
jgi:hypothetical protein